MSWTGNLRRLAALTWADRWLLVQASAWLGLVSIAIPLVPFRRIAAWVGLVPGEGRDGLASDRPAAAGRIGWAVRVAAARTPWTSACLAQALAGTILLRRRGLPATLYLGVAQDAGVPEGMSAHAWLRCGDAILTGAARREHFGVISAMTDRTGGGSRD